MQKIIKIILVLFVVVFFNACKKKCCDPNNPDCENYDPCNGKKRINAIFRVRPGDRGFKPEGEWCDLIPCDTFSESSVRFDMPINNPSNSKYSWQVGTEPTPRTGKSFEVSFSDYLNAGKWETHIPVTLTIRTPLNSCMTHPEDTLIKVTRELFFQEKEWWLIPFRETSASYRGYFTNNPSKETIITFIDQKRGYFRGVEAPVFLIVGFPFVDTLLSPTTHLNESCNNFKNSKFKILFPEQNTPKLSFYLSLVENYFINENKIRNIYEFNRPSGFERYEFIGERI